MTDFTNDTLSIIAKLSYEGYLHWCKYTKPSINLVKLGYFNWFLKIIMLRITALNIFFRRHPLFNTICKKRSKKVNSIIKNKNLLSDLFRLYSIYSDTNNININIEDTEYSIKSKITGGYLTHLLSRQFSSQNIYYTDDIDFKIIIGRELFQKLNTTPSDSLSFKNQIKDTINDKLTAIPDTDTDTVCEFKNLDQIKQNLIQIGKIAEFQQLSREYPTNRSYNSKLENPLKINKYNKVTKVFSLNISDISFSEDNDIFLSGNNQSPFVNNPKLMITKTHIDLEIDYTIIIDGKIIGILSSVDILEQIATLINITNNFNEKLQNGDIPFIDKLYNWCLQMQVYYHYIMHKRDTLMYSVGKDIRHLPIFLQ